MKPANGDTVDVGDTSGVLILRNLLKRKEWPGESGLQARPLIHFAELSG